MEIYTTLPEIKSNELKYGEYPETDKNILCDKINTFYNIFFSKVSKDLFEHGNYFFIDILPTNGENIVDLLKEYIGYDFKEEDCQQSNITELYQKMLGTDDMQGVFEELFEDEYVESCYVGNPMYCMPNTNIFYVLLDVYCIRYKNYTLIISYGNDE